MHTASNGHAHVFMCNISSHAAAALAPATQLFASLARNYIDDVQQDERTTRKEIEGWMDWICRRNIGGSALKLLLNRLFLETVVAFVVCCCTCINALVWDLFAPGFVYDSDACLDRRNIFGGMVALCH